MTVGSIFGRRGLSARTHTRVQRRQLQKKKNPKIDEVAAVVASGPWQVSVSAASLVCAVPVSTRQPSVTSQRAQCG